MFDLLAESRRDRLEFQAFHIFIRFRRVEIFQFRIRHGKFDRGVNADPCEL